MNKIKLTVREKRFLVIWIAIHGIAVFLSITGIQGRKKHTFYEENHSIYSSSSKTEEFWPFAGFFEQSFYTLEGQYGRDFITGTKYNLSKEYTQFQGIFNGYDFTEFVAYIIIGLGIVFIPKFLKKNKNQISIFVV